VELNYYHIIALLMAFLFDKILGDPLWLPHPVVAFGHMIAFFEKRGNQNTQRILKGALSSLFLIVLVFLAGSVSIHFTYQINKTLGCVLESILIFYCIAGTTLIKEGKAVFNVLEKEGVESGRKQVSRIVGRDTASMNEQQIKKATLETLAENLSDGVVAPLFWYLIAGVPGMLAYKMINTLDSMIGYKNERYLLYGRFAAKMDDVVNFIPARITAFLMALVSHQKRAFQFLVRYGRAHSSPNSGYPEAALAGVLHVQFGGTHDYFGKPVVKPFIGENNRSIIQQDLRITIFIMRLVEVVVVFGIVSMFILR
jgi:adenosylcobinamide-phosphate synthase